MKLVRLDIDLDADTYKSVWKMWQEKREQRGCSRLPLWKFVSIAITEWVLSKDSKEVMAMVRKAGFGEDKELYRLWAIGRIEGARKNT